MKSLTTAQDTWNWLKATGRISGAAEQVVAMIGEDKFLHQAAKQWEAEGAQRFMQGMKDVMLGIIWND